MTGPVFHPKRTERKPRLATDVNLHGPAGGMVPAGSLSFPGAEHMEGSAPEAQAGDTKGYGQFWRGRGLCCRVMDRHDHDGRGEEQG